MKGPVADSSTQPIYLDISLKPDAVWEMAVKPEQTVLLMVFSGATTELAAGQMGIYQQGDTLSLAASEHGARALMLAGTPIREPISQYGPFVMNTEAEIEQAMRDYRAGRLVA